MIPTLRKEREGWGTRFVQDAYKDQSLGHPARVMDILLQAFVVPALRKSGEGRGSHFVQDAHKDQSLVHPAPTLYKMPTKIRAWATRPDYVALIIAGFEG